MVRNDAELQVRLCVLAAKQSLTEMLRIEHKTFPDLIKVVVLEDGRREGS